MTDDRKIHASTSDMELVRYNKMGKWYIEPKDKSLPRQHVNMDQAVQVALWWKNNADGEVFLKLPGGTRFDQLVRLNGAS